MANRTQKLVLAFFALAWVGLVAILAWEPEIYDRALKLPDGSHRLADLAFLVAVSAFIALLALGVLRRWRWVFWLILIAFLFGVVRAAVCILQLAGVLPATGPSWYTLLQALLGVLQFAIGMLMLAGYRQRGVWGAFCTQTTEDRRSLN